MQQAQEHREIKDTDRDIHHIDIDIETEAETEDMDTVQTHKHEHKTHLRGRCGPCQRQQGATAPPARTTAGWARCASCRRCRYGPPRTTDTPAATALRWQQPCRGRAGGHPLARAAQAH
jgi:hypothetical protein